LIVLALFADRPELAEDPDKTWGVATLELLGPGLRGLMLACMLAALMSSVDCYMLVSSALVVRNIYAAYINPEATEARYVLVGRITGIAIVAGAVLFSWYLMDVFKQLQLTWIVPMIFAAPFWVGMFWRRATKHAAWGTIFYALSVFFIIPWLAPVVMPAMREGPRFTTTTNIVTTISTRPATPSDVRRRQAAIALWERQKTGPQPESLEVGDSITDTFVTGGKPIYWSGDVKPVGALQYEIISRDREGDTEIVVTRYACPLKASGNFNLDFVLYDWLGMDLTTKSNAMLATLELPPKIVTPLLVMILLSLVTPRNSKPTLDRYYAKMKTPVLPDHDRDHEELERSYADPDRYNHKRLIPWFGLEIQKPTLLDLAGFVGTFIVCFLIVFLAVLVASLGG
jgi:SSS family solute:Na+ symporter